MCRKDLGEVECRWGTPLCAIVDETGGVTKSGALANVGGLAASMVVVGGLVMFGYV